MAYVIKPKRTLEEFLRWDNALRGCGLEGGVELRGQTPLRFASSHLHTFRVDVKDKIISIMDFPIILSKQRGSKYQVTNLPFGDKTDNPP